MRVAFLSYQWPGLRMGGIGSYVRQSAAALALAGHQPHVFTIGDEDALPDNLPAGVVLHQTPDPARRVFTSTLPAELAAALNSGGEAVYRLAIAWLLTAAFQREHSQQAFDIVEAADVDASGLPLLLDAGQPLPVVVHLHTCTAIANRINNRVSGPQEQLIEAMEAAQIHLADAVCAPTRAVLRSTEALVPLNSEPATIAHPYVCPGAAFTPPPADGPVVFVGRLEWRKGCGVIAEALNGFLARHAGARFRFIGPDTNTAPGESSVRLHIIRTLAASVRDRVEFTGELPPRQVEAALSGCSFCVLPSLSENFSLAICEAMAAGRTTIIAAGTGSVELLGDAGVAVEGGSAASLLEAMDSIYRNRGRLNELSRLAFDRVRSLCDPISVSRQRVDFYRRVITEFGRRTPGYTSDRLASLPAAVAAAVLPCLCRITAALLRIDGPADSPGRRLDDICQKLTAGQNESARVLLYGAGKHTARLLSERHRWERHGHRVIGLIDDHPRFLQSPRYLGLPVRSLADVQTDAIAGNRLPAVVLSTDTYEEQFWEQTRSLREHGVRVFRLYGR
ncbi:MAG: glycosyltransferase family 4 protein [Tepidisphaeraceae bacterium]|jgi:glycosyltransferase involved in cell wall biosynthesis